ncbi:hypothetical protein F0726_01211 [Acidithiobacillus caldus]|nr:hypothetical protein F0726_01211 [Acidithiobacillus caldus]
MAGSSVVALPEARYGRLLMAGWPAHRDGFPSCPPEAVSPAA